MLVSTPDAALNGARVAVVGTSDSATIRALVAARPEYVLDVHGRLGADAEALPGYEGIAW
jgi:GDP-mannose 6-dehydrogenase